MGAGGYDLFVSYSTDPDYRLVRQLQSLLEGFHQLLREPALPPLEVFMDESDLIRPGAGGGSDGAIRSLLQARLGESRRLLVICSSNATRSPWVAEEIAWFLQHGRSEDILVGLSEQVPASAFGAVLPAPLIEARVHERPYFDFRGFVNPDPPLDWKVRSFEEQVLALAAFLHGRTVGELAPLWEREAQKRQRQLEDALADALRGRGHAAMVRDDPQQAATYFARALEHRDDGNLRSDLLRVSQEVWTYRCLGGQHREGSSRWVSWSFDGEFLAGKRGPGVQVWDRHSDRLAAVLQPKRLSVHGGAFSPVERRLLLTGSGERPIQLWDPDSANSAVECGEGLSEASAAWSPDGARIAVLTPHELRILDRSGAELFREALSPTSMLTQCRWSASGAKLACWGGTELCVFAERGQRLERVERDVTSWDWMPGDRLVFIRSGGIHFESASIPLPGASSDPTHVTASPSGRYLAVTFGNRLGLSRLETESWTWYQRGSTPTPVWSPGRDRVALVESSGALQLVDAERPTPVAYELAGPASDLSMQGITAGWSPDGAYLAAAVPGYQLAVWNATTGTRQLVLDADLLPGVPASWSPDGDAIAAGSMHGELQMWARATQWRPRRLVGEKIIDLAWSPSGAHCATLEGPYEQPRLVIRDGGGRERHAVTLEQAAFQLCWDGDGNVIARHKHGLVTVEPGTGAVIRKQPLAQVNGDLGRNGLPPSRCYQRVEDSRSRMLDLAPIRVDEGTIPAVGEELSPDGRLLVLRDQPDALRVIRLADSSELGRIHDQGIEGGDVSWSLSGEWLAVHGQASVLLVKIAPTHIQGQWQFLASDVIGRRAWSPRHDRLALAMADGVTVILDAASHRSMSCERNMRSIVGLAWTPDGSLLSVTSSGQQVVMFDALTGRVVLAVPDRVDQEVKYVTTLNLLAGKLAPSCSVLPVAEPSGEITLWDYPAALEPARVLGSRIETITGLAIVKSQAMGFRDLFSSGIAALLRGDLQDGWERCDRALALAPHSRRFLAQYGVAKAALQGFEAGRPALVAAWESDRSLETYIWLRASGDPEPPPNRAPFWTALFAHMDGQLENRELWKQANHPYESDSQGRAIAAVAIGRRQDLAGLTRPARTWYIKALSGRISRIDELWVKLRLLFFDHQAQGQLTARVDPAQ